MDQIYGSLIKYLNSITFLPDSELEELKCAFSCRRIKKNELFLSAGEQMSHIAFNINGVFRYFYIDYEGNDKTKYIILENNFILSLVSFIDNSPAAFSIEAVEDCDILAVPTEKLKLMIKSNIYWQRIFQYILQKTYVEKEKREAEFLLYNAKDRYLHFLNDYPAVHSRIKQHHIASYLGIAPETLSRIRSQIEKS